MGRGRARRKDPTAADPATPPPTASRDDGSAVWEVGPFVVGAHPATGVDAAVVVLDGRAVGADTALALADALRAAVLRIEEDGS